jgi:NADP-dependent 3-hydroxy acid dehydrogenase YdfG
MGTKMFEKAGEVFPPEKKFMDVDEIAEIVTFAMSQKGNIAIEEIRVDKY